MCTNPPFTFFEITLIQIHFTKTTLGFSVITKIPFLLALLNFQKLHIKHTSFTLINTYFTLTKYMTSITNIRTITVGFLNMLHHCPPAQLLDIWSVNVRYRGPFTTRNCHGGRCNNVNGYEPTTTMANRRPVLMVGLPMIGMFVRCR
jgi:hypothetical protein